MKNGTKDKLPIYLFYTSFCCKTKKIPKIYTKAIKRQKLQIKKILKGKRFKII